MRVLPSSLKTNLSEPSPPNGLSHLILHKAYLKMTLCYDAICPIAETARFSNVKLCGIKLGFAGLAVCVLEDLAHCKFVSVSDISNT